MYISNLLDQKTKKKSFMVAIHRDTKSSYLIRHILDKFYTFLKNLYSVYLSIKKNHKNLTHTFKIDYYLFSCIIAKMEVTGAYLRRLLVVMDLLSIMGYRK